MSTMHSMHDCPHNIENPVAVVMRAYTQYYTESEGKSGKTFQGIEIVQDTPHRVVFDVTLKTPEGELIHELNAADFDDCVGCPG